MVDAGKTRVYISAAVLLLEKHLREQPLGTRFSYDDLKEICGKDVRENRSIIVTVNRRLVQHHDRTLLSIRGFGYALAKDDEIADISSLLRKSAQKKVVRAYSVLKTVDISQLSSGDKAKFLKEQAVAGTTLAVMKAVSDKKTLAKKPDELAIPSESQVMALFFKTSNNV